MASAVNTIQLNDLEEVQVVVDEEKAVSSKKNDNRFAELLEYFWNEDEKAEAVLSEE